MLQYISMILGIAIVVFMMLKGWNPAIIGLCGATAIIFLNGLDFGDAVTNTFFVSYGSMFTSLFPPIFSGCLLCQTYTRSGAVLTIADTMISIMFKNDSDENKASRYAKAIITMVIIAGMISYCGINSLVVLIAMYPITLRVMEKVGIPKRFVMGILSGGVYTFAITAPGTTETVNILAMQAVGTPAYAGIVGGVVACVVEVVVMSIVLSLLIKKAVANGETFAYGEKDYNAAENENRKRPGMFISMLPLITLIILFNVFSLNIFTATIIGWLMSAVLFRPYMNGLGELRESCGDAAVSAFAPCNSVGALVGFATILQSLPNFQTIMDSIFSLDLSPAFILIIAVSLIAGLTGSSSSAVRVGIPMVLDRCRLAGLTDAFIHRVSCFAATTIDTLPWSTAVIINLGISDLKLKDAYPPMFVSTCLATACGTIVCAVIMYAFPFLP